MFNLSIIDNVQIKWLSFIKSIFEKTGLNYLWNQQQPVHSVQLKLIVKQNLTDQYIQNWFNQIENSSIINWNKFTAKPLYISRGTFK
jgi:hypothetical protein